MSKEGEYNIDSEPPSLNEEKWSPLNVLPNSLEHERLEEDNDNYEFKVKLSNPADVMSPMMVYMRKKLPES